MIKRKGTIVSVGNASGAVEPFSLFRLIEKNVKLLRPTWVLPLFLFFDIFKLTVAHVTTRMSNYVYTAEEAFYYGQEVWKLIVNGDLKINIFKEYSFTTEGVREAQRDLTEGKTTGKLLIKIAD
jgi:NADPH2:quinone reductase